MTDKASYSDYVTDTGIDTYRPSSRWMKNPLFMLKRAMAYAPMILPLPSGIVRAMHVSRGARIARRVMISYGVYIDAISPEKVTIEEDVIIAPFARIFAHYRPTDSLRKYIPPRVSSVRIRKGAMIAAGAIVLPGVTVGECSMVAAGSVVTKDVPPRTVVAGNPAKVVKKLV